MLSAMPMPLTPHVDTFAICRRFYRFSILLRDAYMFAMPLSYCDTLLAMPSAS